MSPATVEPISRLMKLLSRAGQMNLRPLSNKFSVNSSLASLIYVSYMTLLLVDKFKILLAITFLMFVVLKPPKGVITLKVVLLQLVFLFIAARCFWFGVIPEGKFFIIYISAIYSGAILARIIAAQSTWRFVAYISSIALAVHLLQMFDVHVISTEIEKEILLTNYAEILIFHLLASSYLKGDKSNLLALGASFISGSKFMMLSFLLMSISKRGYIFSLPIILLIIFIWNPYQFLNSRLFLINIFYENISFDLLMLGNLISVNDLIKNESTLYSFHNIWIDYLWYGGFVGIVGLLIHLYIVFKALSCKQSIFSRSIIVMYLTCITFGFAVFFGTKYMMLMLGVILFKLHTINQNDFIPKTT